MTTPDSSRRRYGSVKECAEIYSLHEMTIRKLIASGEIKSIRLGRAVRIDLRRLEEDLEAQIQGGPIRRPSGRAIAEKRAAGIRKTGGVSHQASGGHPRRLPSGVDIRGGRGAGR